MSSYKDAFCSHRTDDWSTPKFFYQYFIDLGFFDPCPLNHDGWDALMISWKDFNFVNPPYSDISRFIDKALVECELGNLVVLFLPCRTNTKWFKKLYDYGHTMFVFVHGGVTFGNAKKSAPFSSFIAVLSDRILFNSISLMTLKEMCSSHWLPPEVYLRTAHEVSPGGCPSRMRRVASSVRRPLDYADAGPKK